MSTKMDVCARICAHYLAHDDVGDVSFVDGKPVFPDTSVPPQAPQQKRRIVIYSEFSSMAPLLQNVCITHGRPCCYLTLFISGLETLWRGESGD